MEELNQDLQSLFPRTLVQLERNGLEEVVEQFAEEKLPAHWFPPFLKQQKLSPVIFELAQYEWLQVVLQDTVADAGGGDAAAAVSTDAGLVQLNENVQFLYLSAAQPDLGLSQGLWAFLPGDRKLCLNQNQAILIDLLSEERKYTRHQLLEMVTVEAPIKDVEGHSSSSSAIDGHFEKDLEVLIENGVIVQ